MPAESTGRDRSAALVALGTGAALAVALPAALAAQVADAVADGDAGAVVTYPLAALVLAGAAVGGWVVGRRAARAPARHGGLSGLLAIAVVQLVGVVRRTVADEDVAWAAVPAVLVVGTLLGAGAASLAAQRAGRTRP